MRLEVIIDGSLGLPLTIDVWSGTGRRLAQVRLLELAPGRVAARDLLRMPPRDEVIEQGLDLSYTGAELARRGLSDSSSRRSGPLRAPSRRGPSAPTRPSEGVTSPADASRRRASGGRWR